MRRPGRARSEMREQPSGSPFFARPARFSRAFGAKRTARRVGAKFFRQQPRLR